jgi:hypothetical protein
MRFLVFMAISLSAIGCSSVRTDPTTDESDQVVQVDRKIGFENISGGVAGRQEWAKEDQEASPGFICVTSSGPAWIYKHPPHTGSGHGDGFAQFDIRARIHDRSGKPISGCEVWEMPSRQFGGVRVETLVSKADDAGKVAFKTSVGAAITLSGDFAGDIYQSCLKTFVLKAPGHEDMRITVGFGCPEMLVYMKPANKTLERTR